MCVGRLNLYARFSVRIDFQEGLQLEIPTFVQAERWWNPQYQGIVPDSTSICAVVLLLPMLTLELKHNRRPFPFLLTFLLWVGMVA